MNTCMLELKCNLRSPKLQYSCLVMQFNKNGGTCETHCMILFTNIATNALALALYSLLKKGAQKLQGRTL